MTQRDKSFLVILLSAVAGIGVVSYFGYTWFWAPLKAYNASIEQLEGEHDGFKQEWLQFSKARARLEAAKLRSLPARFEQATTEFIPFLETTFRDAGLQVGQVLPGASAARIKAPSTVPEIKEVDHRTIAFTIKAIGDEAALVSALERLRKSPYEHRVKDLNVERVSTEYGSGTTKQLKITMTIEALLVAGNKNTMGLHPGIDPQFYLYNHIAARNGAAPAGWGLWASSVASIVKQAERQGAGPPRDYADIAKRNIFVGVIPLAKPSSSSGKKGGVTLTAEQKALLEAEEAAKRVAPPEFVPRFVYLTTVVPSMQEAFLRNRLHGGREDKLIAKPRSGYEYFRITDDVGVYEFFKAKILEIGTREIYFQVRDQVYVQRIGENLATAMRAPLSVEQMLDLDLYEVYDKEFAKEQLADAKKKPDQGKRGKTGKGR